MLASRLLSILMQLQTRGRMTAPELAEAFEVSVRTIYRDIDQLSAAGIPVYAERGREGGFLLRDGYRTKLTGLTPEEAETLFLAGLPGPAAELGLADLMATTRLKLLAALPAHVQPSAERVAARFHLDPTGWFRAGDAAPCLPEIARAVWSERHLAIGYRSGGRTHALRLGPLGLVLKGGVWYLVAESSRGIRTYRAGAILDARATDEPYERPKAFDLAAHWARAARAYEAGLYRETAEVRLSPRGWSWLEQLGPYVTEAAHKSAGPPDPDGWIRCTLPIESAGFGIRELMRLADEVEVLGPAPFRAAFLRTLASMRTLHARRRRGAAGKAGGARSPAPKRKRRP